MTTNNLAHNQNDTVAKQPQAIPPTLELMTERLPTPATLVQRAQQNPNTLTPDNVLQLQRTLGNQAVVQLLGRTTPTQKSVALTREPVVQRDGPAASKPQKEKRELGTKDSVWEGDGWKNITDTFDYTIVVARPDGTGAQLTFVPEDNKTEGEAPSMRLIKVVELSKRRVRALEEMSKKQGTYQETEAERITRDGKFTRCNAWPINVGDAVDGLEGTTNAAGDKTDGVKGATKKSSKLNNLNPEGEARRYGAWRTWADTPEGPKPGDIYSFWEAEIKPTNKTPLRQATSIERKTGTIKHIGIFKSRRPDPGGETETWTVVDGGQGGPGQRQQIWERNRTFDIKTQIFTTTLADGGQGADPRWISGWLDLDLYYENAENDETKADYAKWVKAGGAERTHYEPPKEEVQTE